MKSAAKFSRTDYLLLLLLAGLVALFFWRILTPNPADRAQFPAGDFTDQFYAFRLYEARAFAEGRIPLWSENFNSGHPFLADIQSAVFYPPALVNTLLNLALFQSFSLFALELEALVHFFLAGAFTYLFARRVLLRVRFAPDAPLSLFAVRAAAFVSAIVFTFGGYLTSYPSLQLAILETAAWLPLALYFLDRAIDDTSIEYSPIRETRPPSSIFRPEPALSHGEGSGASPEPRRRVVRPPALIAAGITLGIAALAGHPQTLFFVLGVCVIYFVWRVAQVHPGSLRNVAFDVRLAGTLALTLVIAFGIAAVQWLPALEYQQLSTRESLSFAEAAAGFPTLDVLQFILPGYASAFASPLYVGILPLWLALFALFQKHNETIFWGLVALGALILSFGFYVFAYVVLYLFIPGASLFRGQERMAFVVSFALAMLAGYGMLALLSSIQRARAHRLYFILPAGAVITLVLLLAFFVANALQPEGASAGRLAFLGDRAGLMLLLFALASLLLGLYLRGVLGAKWFVPLAIVLILFDLWSVSEPANKGRVEDRFADVPFAAQLQAEPGIFRVAADAQLLPGHFGIPTQLEEIGGISPLRLARYDALLQLPQEMVLPLLNVNYVITRANAGLKANTIAHDGDVELLQLDQPLPRAWLVGTAVTQTDDVQAAALMSQLDLRHNAILASPAPFALDPRAAEGQVSIPARSAEHMTLDVNAPANGLVILSENYYPGWRATIDGQSADILRADLTLRALPVTAGQHHIEIWYDPFSLKLGAAISIITLAASIAAILYFTFRRP